MLGEVKWYSNNHGYGFAKTDEGEEVFLHKCVQQWLKEHN